MNSQIAQDSPLPSQDGNWFVTRMVVTWVVALILGTVVTLTVPAENRAEWLVAVIGFCAVLTFILQIGTAQKVGFIARMSFSIAGAVLLTLLVEAGTLLLSKVG